MIPAHDIRLDASLYGLYAGELNTSDALDANTLTIVLLGDYNGNGVVDAADNTVCKDNFGSTTDRRADGNGNGIVDAADHTVWRDNFGLVGSPPATSVPEPAGIFLAAPFALLLMAQQQNRPHRIASLARSRCHTPLDVVCVDQTATAFCIL